MYALASFQARPLRWVTPSRLASLAACICCLFLVACERSEDVPASPPESRANSSSEPKGSSGPSASDEAERPAEPNAWRQVEQQQLDEAGREMLKQAQSARKQLGSTLKQELTDAVSEKSFSGAVDFCHSRAPEIAAEVAERTNVEIGRTSHRLRNADNAPPSWAKEAVERKKARSYLYRGPDGRLGYLHPIETKALCINCHGSDDQLAPDVSTMLDKHYPEDEATGFEVGDLRGWFWVEVPRRGS